MYFELRRPFCSVLIWLQVNSISSNLISINLDRSFSISNEFNSMDLDSSNSIPNCRHFIVCIISHILPYHSILIISFVRHTCSMARINGSFLPYCLVFRYLLYSGAVSLLLTPPGRQVPINLKYSRETAKLF